MVKHCAYHAMFFLPIEIWVYVCYNIFEGKQMKKENKIKNTDKEIILDKTGTKVMIGDKEHIIKDLPAGGIAILADKAFLKLANLRKKQHDAEPYFVKGMIFQFVGGITLIASLLCNIPLGLASAVLSGIGLHNFIKFIKQHNRSKGQIKNYRRLKIVLLAEYMRRIKKGEEDLTFADKIMEEVIDKEEKRKREQIESKEAVESENV